MLNQFKTNNLDEFKFHESRMDTRKIQSPFIDMEETSLQFSENQSQIAICQLLKFIAEEELEVSQSIKISI